MNNRHIAPPPVSSTGPVAPMRTEARTIPRKSLALATALALFGTVLFSASFIASQPAAGAVVVQSVPANHVQVPAGGTFNFNLGNYVSENVGGRTIRCDDFSPPGSSRIQSVSQSNNDCNYTIRAKSTASAGREYFNFRARGYQGNIPFSSGTVRVQINVLGAIVFNAPTNLSVVAGNNMIFSALGYASDGSNTITCGNPSGVDSTKITVSRNNCFFTVTALATATTGNTTFTTLLTSSTTVTRSATFTINITPASNFMFTAPPNSIPIGVGSTKTIDVSSYAADGNYAIQCRFNSNTRHSRIASVTTDGCNFSVRAGTTQGAATLSVLYTSAGGVEQTGVVPLTIGPRSILIYQRVSTLRVRTGGTIRIDAGSYAHDQGGYSVSCGDATAIDSKITVNSRNGCVYNITAGNTAGTASFTVPYTSEGGNARTGRIDIAVVSSNIVFTAPVSLSAGIHDTIRINAADYASDGTETISCGTITQSHSLIASINESGCSISVTAGGTAGMATFTVPYSSSGGDTHDGQISLVIGSVPAVFAARCTDGTFVDTSDYPRVSGIYNDLVEDCQALVAIRDLWAAEAANNNIAASNPIRLWGTGSGSQRMIQNWQGVTISGNRVSAIDIAATDATDSISGTLTTHFGRLTALTSLDLSGNSLIGSIPSSISSLTSLTSLDLSSNQLTGTIPSGAAGIVRLTALTSLDLSGNSLTGSIPTSISSLTSLTSLDLSSNQLTGAIPSGIGSLTALTSLDLSSNRLTGTIPAQLSSLAVLVDLLLGSNHLSGSIPAQLGNINTLNLLSFCGNYLTGAVPSSLRSGVTLLGYNIADGYDPIACQRESNIRYTPPAGLGVSVSDTLTIEADEYADDGIYTIECGDPSGISASLTSVTRAPNTCRFTVTAGASPGTGSFTVIYTSSGGDTHTATITVAISLILFSPPAGLSVAAGQSITIDASSYASEAGHSISCSDATNIDSKFSAVTRTPNSCTYRITARASSEGSASFTVPYSSTNGGSLNGIIPVSITPAPARPEMPPPDQGSPQPESQQPIDSAPAPTTTRTEVPEETDVDSGWNTFTVQAGGTTARTIRQRLGLPTNQAFYIWDTETQGWARVTSLTRTIPAGTTVSFHSQRGLGTEELETVGLGHNTQEASLNNGWNIINAAGDIVRVRDRDFLIDDALIDCGRLQGVIAVTSYNPTTRRWSLWLPCHPRTEARYTAGTDPPYDLLTSVGEGDSVYIYIRSRIPVEIVWNTETQTYELG